MLSSTHYYLELNCGRICFKMFVEVVGRTEVVGAVEIRGSNSLLWLVARVCLSAVVVPYSIGAPYLTGSDLEPLTLSNLPA